MKHSKKVLFFLFSLFVGATISAQNTLVIELRDDSCVTFLLTEKPRVTFVGEQLNIVSSSASMELKRGDVKNWHFIGTPSSVESIATDAKVVLEGNALFISGITDDTVITLYKVSGVAVRHSDVVNGVCTMPLNDLAAGIYVVRYNNTSFKFLKK